MTNSFTGPYRFLSNFWMVNIEYAGQIWPSAEHAFQAAKVLDPELKEKIRKAIGPGAAKRLGRLVMKRVDWEDIKIQVMRDILLVKFDPIKQPELHEWLLATEGHELIEGNTWGDMFWGVCDGIGENNLGKLLMSIRDSFIETRGAICES